MTRTIIVTIISLFMTNFTAFAAVETGKAAPDFSALSAAGNSISLSDYKGKKIVLEWTNHQCPFVVKHYSSGNMQTLQKAAIKDDVIWLRVISSAKGNQGYVSGEEALEIAKKQGAHPTATLIDAKGEVGKLYGAKTTPHMFIIDENGIIAYQGAIDNIPSPSQDDIAQASNFVTLTLASLKAGTAVNPATTQPYGCSVKY